MRGGKPWLDGSTSESRPCRPRCACRVAAMRDFAQVQVQWYPTWPAAAAERALVVCVPRICGLCGVLMWCAGTTSRCGSCADGGWVTAGWLIMVWGCADTHR
jgi:hypothetical protein